MNVIRTERGWGGHYICNNLCLFRRNTLLECNDKKYIISTVGNMYIDNKLEPIGAFNRLYETMVFESDDSKYNDVNVSKEVYFESNWALDKQDDIKANEMHETVVNEIIKKIKE